MLPPDGTLAAGLRWLRLLKGSSYEQSWAILRSGSAYSDLSATQYGAAIDWLTETGLIQRTADGFQLAVTTGAVSDGELAQLLFRAALEWAPPAWVRDADLMVPTPEDLPEDVRRVAEELGVNEDAAFVAVGRAHRKVDLERRAEIGLAGERVVVAVLEATFPGTTQHVAAHDDGLGYDVAFLHADATWHLEVKSTTRRGRLLIYLSRNEFEVARRDPHWRLVIAGLTPSLELGCLATVDFEAIAERAPTDAPSGARWESARYDLRPGDLADGIAVGQPEQGLVVLGGGGPSVADRFSWMPH